MDQTMRAFVAFELPGQVVEQTAALQADLKTQGLKLRWVKPQNLHLTLKFLGDIPAAHAPRVGSAMQKAVADHPPVEMTLQGMGVFPGFKRPRVLWIGFGGQVDELEHIYQRLEDELEAVGFEREKRGFRAHLTIARIKGAVPGDTFRQVIQQTADFSPLQFSARRLVLYQSVLRPQGAVYTALQEVDLTES